LTPFYIFVLISRIRPKIPEYSRRAVNELSAFTVFTSSAQQSTA